MIFEQFGPISGHLSLLHKTEKVPPPLSFEVGDVEKNKTSKKGKMLKSEGKEAFIAHFPARSTRRRYFAVFGSCRGEGVRTPLSFGWVQALPSYHQPHQQKVKSESKRQPICPQPKVYGALKRVSRVSFLPPFRNKEGA